jgi:hypothetical protein
MLRLAWIILAITGSAVTAHAQAGFARAPPTAAPPPAPDAGSDERTSGPMVGVQFNGGRSITGINMEAGFLVHPNIAIFGAATVLVVFGPDGKLGGAGLVGGGVRLRVGRVFADAQLAIKDPAGMVSAGVEILSGKSSSLDVHVSQLLLFDEDGTNKITMIGIGLHAYR